MITDCSNFDKRCSDAHFVPFLSYYYCTLLTSYHYINGKKKILEGQIRIWKVLFEFWVQFLSKKRKIMGGIQIIINSAFSFFDR